MAIDWSALRVEAEAELTAAATPQAVEEARVRWLGRSGRIALALRDVGKLPPEERPQAGVLGNEVRAEVEAMVATRRAALRALALQARLAAETIDVTLPGQRPRVGHEHPLHQVWHDLVRIFGELGFAVADGPEVETDWYNFGALNIPADHPTRDAQDSFYVDSGLRAGAGRADHDGGLRAGAGRADHDSGLRAGAAGADHDSGLRAGANRADHDTGVRAGAGRADHDTGADREGQTLLRTQTSPVQVRTMQALAPGLPVRVVAPGRVYRRDTTDATHSAVFHQIEGLLVDRGIAMSHMKGVIAEFARRLYGPKTRIRVRPSYFPFTEPSGEVDVTCAFCRGTGCRICKGTGWIEIMGCGMVHPQVLRNGGYDPEEVSGFAFGMGIDRVAQLRYGVDDLRHFLQNDLRFLEQF